MKPPAKHKPRESWTVEETLQHMRDGTEPVSPEFADYVRDAAEAAGLAVEDLGLPPEPIAERDPESLTVEDHIERQRNR